MLRDAETGSPACGSGNATPRFGGGLTSNVPFAATSAMSLHNVTPGARAPDEFNVIIEIPMNADPIKYEVDK